MYCKNWSLRFAKAAPSEIASLANLSQSHPTPTWLPESLHTSSGGGGTAGGWSCINVLWRGMVPLPRTEACSLLSGSRVLSGLRYVGGQTLWSQWSHLALKLMAEELPCVFSLRLLEFAVLEIRFPARSSAQQGEKKGV